MNGESENDKPNESFLYTNLGANFTAIVPKRIQRLEGRRNVPSRNVLVQSRFSTMDTNIYPFSNTIGIEKKPRFNMIRSPRSVM